MECESNDSEHDSAAVQLTINAADCKRKVETNEEKK